MEDLPNDILVEILSFLDPKEVEISSLVCRKWYNLTNDVRLWKKLCKTARRNSADQLIALSPKDYFISQLELRLFKVRSFQCHLDRAKMHLRSLHRSRVEELQQFKKYHKQQANRIDTHQRTVAVLASSSLFPLLMLFCLWCELNYFILIPLQFCYSICTYVFPEPDWPTLDFAFSLFWFYLCYLTSNVCITYYCATLLHKQVSWKVQQSYQPSLEEVNHKLELIDQKINKLDTSLKYQLVELDRKSFGLTKYEDQISKLIQDYCQAIKGIKKKPFFDFNREEEIMRIHSAYRGKYKNNDCIIL